MIRSYVYLSRTKVESILAQVAARGPRISKVDLKVAAVELDNSPTEPFEQLLIQAERELAAAGLVAELDTAGPAEYFYGRMGVRWGRVDCDWGEVGPDPTVMFISRSAGTQIALYGSLQHMIGHSRIEGSTTGSFGFVLWDLIYSQLNRTEPRLVDRDYHGISAGRDLMDSWSEDEKHHATHSTLKIVCERMRYDDYVEFLAIVHKRFDCTSQLGYSESGHWVLGSPLFVARATPPRADLTQQPAGAEASARRAQPLALRRLRSRGN